MRRFLFVLVVAAGMFAACPPHFMAVDEGDAGTAQAAVPYRSELARLAVATAAMRQTVQAANMELPEPRPEVLFPQGR
ncbi:hypothetical protein G3N56_13545 [Desulfovibrio sulfodismutans]|uniref:Uncharacterized protein n=1 Tax=Desulfolutivibrio sulfodismutans TaxID=63561 RepID=A0A7K3NPM3_9BACT|nr:hypothetical protein [Desulfolutivibrio sulfodismutans]NDY57755.1 hypothetical protein [Desulfolutivibrio sulfodismutans]QLA11570.1 hypothetical protein GD606_04390 [Desulfolutivibrio sulfodismutans DSM 3696]